MTAIGSTSAMAWFLKLSRLLSHLAFSVVDDLRFARQLGHDSVQAPPFFRSKKGIEANTGPENQMIRVFPSLLSRSGQRFG